MATQSYAAILFRQRESAPIQVAFVAPSYEIDAWARVPTKKTGNIRNFQRAQISTHVKEVEQFFNNKTNASPTAVVVGFDPIRSQGKIRILGLDDNPILENSITGGQSLPCRFEINWEEPPLLENTQEHICAISNKRDSIKKAIFSELKGIASISSEQLENLITELETITPLEESGNEEAIEEESTESEDTDENEANELAPSPELAIPETIRAKLAGLSPSEQQLIAGRLIFLAQLNQQYLQTRPLETLKSLHQEIQDELKPGILIDGQHRIGGTKKLGNIPFLVTALPAAPWPELAFQFIVTNRTAKRVPESLLISIVGNSLSQQQRADIEDRLRQANIRVGLIEAVMRVHEDEQSPFYGLLSFGLKNETGFLDAAAMRGKVIKPWYERQKDVTQLFDHLCTGRTRAERTENWKSEEIWFQFFISFWSAVRTRYEGSAVFSTELENTNMKHPASKLMTATALMIFQEAILEHLRKHLQNKANTEDIPMAASLPSEDKFAEMVKNTLSKLTPDFFTEWQLTGFDGSKGARTDLKDAITRVISGEKTVAQLKNPKQPHRLFRKQD